MGILILPNSIYISRRLFLIHLRLFWGCVVCSAWHSRNKLLVFWKSFLKKFAFLCILTMMNGIYLETPKLLRDVVVYRTVLFLLFWNPVFLWPVKLMFGNLLGHFCTCTTVSPARVLVSLRVRGIWFHSPYHHNR